LGLLISDLFPERVLASHLATSAGLIAGVQFDFTRYSISLSLERFPVTAICHAVHLYPAVGFPFAIVLVPTCAVATGRIFVDQLLLSSPATPSFAILSSACPSRWSFFFGFLNSLINSKPSILHLAIFADSSAELTFGVIKFLRLRELHFGGTLACVASYLTECSLWRSPCSHPSKASGGRVFSIEANEGEAIAADRPHPRSTPGRTRKAGSGEKSTSAQTKHVRRRSKSARARNDVNDISECRRSVGAG
jgi:hypothetical protein